MDLSAYSFFKSNDTDQKFKAFLNRLIDSEAWFLDGVFLTALTSLPELISNDPPFWRAGSSGPAQTMLAELDQLRVENRLIGIRAATIIVFVVSKHFAFRKLVEQRLLEDMECEEIERQARIEVGLFIYDSIPRSLLLDLPEGFHSCLLNLLAGESAIDPDYVARSINISLDRRYAELSIQRRAEPVIHFTEDLAMLATLTENLVATDVELVKAILKKLLDASCDLHKYFAEPDLALRRFSAKLFELETATPAQSADTELNVYKALIYRGDALAPWYPAALEKLYGIACVTSDKTEAVKLLCAVAVNSATKSSLCIKAVHQYCNYAWSFRHARAVDLLTIRKQWEIFYVAIEAACNPDCVKAAGRNPMTPTREDHPLLQAATRAFWDFIDWINRQAPTLAAIPLASAVAVLSLPSVVDEAERRLVAVFGTVCHEDKSIAQACLLRLAQVTTSQHGDATASNRCHTLFYKLYPVLLAIDPVLAKTTETSGFRPPYTDR